MHFIVVGLNFKTASVSIREKYHFSNEILPKAYLDLKNYSNIYGSVILSTCNRVEIYASARTIESGYADLVDFLSKFHAIDKMH